MKRPSQKITVLSPGESTSPRGYFEVLCTDEGFAELLQLVADRVDAETAKQIAAVPPDQFTHIGVFRWRPPADPGDERLRDRLALFGCSLATYLMIGIGCICFSLMSLGVGVVMGWLQAN